MADDTTPDLAPPRARKVLRLFLMAAGGLAAPCLALAAFFLSNSGPGGPPAATSAAVQAGHMTATTPAKPPSTAQPRPTTASTTTTTPATAPVAAHPPRDPFVPLVAPGGGGAPAR